MNRIKHTLLLALALLMSVGAWALPSYHIVGSGQGNWMHGIGWVTDAPENEMAYENGIFTITFENVQPGTHEFLFHNGEMLIGKNNNTENPIQFNTSLGVYEGGSSYTFELTAAADVTVTLDVSNQDWTCMVVVEQGISQDQALNWLFTMPDHDADMRLVWKAPADLAWNDVPDGGVSGYRGFHNLVTFPTLANPHSLPVRYGVTDTTIASIDNEGNIVFLAAGQTVVYAIHDFDADYDYDSVTYNLTVLTPATFTLANNEGGIFEVAAGSGSNISTWTSETWQGWNNENKTHTVDGITVTSTGSLSEYTYQVEPPYYLYMYVAGNNASKTLTFSSNSGNFTRIEMTRDTYYPTADIAPTTGWSESAQQNIWEGDAAEVTLTSCTTRVSQIVFYRAGGLSDSVIATAQPNVFEAIPGATITVQATPDSAHYFLRFDEDEALNSNTAVEKTYIVAADMTATANFSSKPTLTLVNNEGGSMTITAAAPAEPLPLLLSTVTATGEISYDQTAQDLVSLNISGVYYNSYYGWVEEGSVTVDVSEGYTITRCVFVQEDGERLEDDIAPFSIALNHAGSVVETTAGEAYNTSMNSVKTIEVYGYTTPEVPASAIVGVMATDTANVFVIDYGTDVTIQATPDSAHYLARFDSDADTNSNAPVEKNYLRITSNTTSTATFTHKPLFTLNPTEGGRIEAIVPQGGMTATQLTSDMVPDWEGNYGESFTEAALQAMGFVSVDSAVAAAWTGAPENGSAKLIYKFDGNNCYFLNFIDGVNYGASHDDYAKGVMYAWTTGPTPLCFTTGTSNANVMPATEENTYIVDYGSDVTVIATPDSAHYIVRFDSDSDTNSNAPVEKTYTGITSNTTSTAFFTHKPVLTLAQNDGGTVTIAGLGNQQDAEVTEIPESTIQSWANDNTPVTEEDLPGFAAISSNAALEWGLTANIEEGYRLMYAFDGSQIRFMEFWDGQFSTEGSYVIERSSIAGSFKISGTRFFYATGSDAPEGILATTDSNTYIVNYGTDVTVQATPAKHYHLVQWSNNVTPGADSTAALNMTEDQTVSATFEKNAPELAWTYRGAEMPAQGVTAYHGFETDTIMLISSTANDEFYMARRQDGAEIHFGSTDTSVASFTDATNPLSITINGAGTTTIYMVHNGSLMAYDSAYFTVNLLAPDTLTLVHNDGGNMTVEMGASNGGLLTTLYANGSALGTTTTNDTVSLAIEGQVMYSASKGWLAEYGAGNEGSITVTAENGFSIDSCVYYFSSGNRSYTISQAPFAVYPACPSSSIAVYDHPGAGVMDNTIGYEGVVRIEVYGHAAADSIRAISENAYAAVPGAIATVKATPDSVHYIVNFDNDAAINSNIAATKSYTVNGNTTSNVTFTAKPILTLNQTEGGELEVVMPEGGVAATHITNDQIPTWQGSYDPVMEADLQPFGFVPVDSATARTWTGAPAVGDAYLIYDFTGEYYKAHLFRDGQLADWANDYFYKGNFYQFANLAYFTTGADMGTGNITAAAEANKYYVDYGTDVTVQATPDKHYHLAAWSRNVTPGADSTAALNMTEDQTVSATFEKNAPELAWRYRRDTMPAEGVTAYLGFTTDTIMLIGTTANDEFLMAYAEEDADLHFGSTNTNVVSFADANDPMSITVNGVGTTTIYMVHNGSLMAYDSVTFPVTILQPATLTIAANGNGTLVVDTVSDSIITTATEGRYHVVHGANINLTSTPADKHYMQTWNDVDTAINSNVVVNRTITVTSDTTISATFAHKPIITLASSDTAWGSVKVQLTNYEQLPEGVVVMEGFENRYIIDYGLRVTLVATATEMHHVSHWVDQNVDSLFAAIYREYFVTDPVDLYPATSRLSFIVTVDTTAKAIFGVNCFDVDASVAPHSFSGTAEITYIDVVDSTLSTGANAVVHAVAKGSTTATITATPATGYHFVGWMDNMNEEPEADTLITENPVSVNVMTNYTAVFDTNVYDITVNIDSIEGSVEGPATVKHFLRGTYTATATPCYHFVNWTNEAGDTISTNPTLTIAAISDSAVTANFELNIYTGDTTAVECDQFVWHGITYTATPEEEPTFVYKNHNNCDSTVTLHLTINYHHDTTIYRQASGGFTFLDNYYTENTTDTLTIETVLHCDSNITLVLAVLPHTTPLPVIYNLMDVALTIDHFEGDTGHIDYIFYRWYKDGAIVSEGIDMDSYSEEGTILNGCYHLEISTDEEHQYWATSNEICVGTTGIDDVEAITLTVAPNPVMHGNKANITVNGAANLQGATATVFDAQGRKVLEFGVQNSTFEIQTSTLPSGIYTVRIVLSDGRMATRKLVVR